MWKQFTMLEIGCEMRSVESCILKVFYKGTLKEIKKDMVFLVWDETFRY